MNSLLLVGEFIRETSFEGYTFSSDVRTLRELIRSYGNFIKFMMLRFIREALQYAGNRHPVY